ncbi:oxaloacetate decarboxylase gamma subunit [Staphylothermus marinus F1]|uniref:Oxaloacetate decarboxylase gamma subunit n=1 Tax=Staphylothermus marinus (strain ATCC 43588 / DSM 3639 / JCM 9404 / F1) TaxID=399550 RepID=A3DPN2_STAMF|nr:OadG family protein [Staphylothermus marinus]ABN70592.1 oxaloacetate decarboxylase gamma subunit [Staphylothermus marinus F1]
MDINTIITGLYITGIGVAIVFSILSILVIIIHVLKQTIYKPVKKMKKEETGKTRIIVEEKPVKTEKPRRETDPQLIALLSATITAFNEYKAATLKKYDLFKDFPELARLLPLAGILFKSKIKVSFGGKDIIVDVEELPNNAYKVSVGGKTYIVNYSIQ